MEGVIASWYAKTTFKDLNRHKLMAKQFVQKIPANGSVLEIAPGPGYFCIELARLGNYQITGLDISKSFVEIARKNAAEAGLIIDFREGNASAMPFQDHTFDFTFCQAAFKNFSEPVKAITEMYRVLNQEVWQSSSTCAAMLRQKISSGKSKAWHLIVLISSSSNGHLTICC